MKRKFVQIEETSNGLLAVADDGTAWCGTDDGWRRVRALPDSDLTAVDEVYESASALAHNCQVAHDPGIRCAHGPCCSNCMPSECFGKATSTAGDLDEVLDSLGRRRADLVRGALKSRDERITRLVSQVDLCALTARGGPRVQVSAGDYRWSGAYDDVLKLRLSFEAALDQLRRVLPRDEYEAAARHLHSLP